MSAPPISVTLPPASRTTSERPSSSEPVRTPTSTPLTRTTPSRTPTSTSLPSSTSTTTSSSSTSTTTTSSSTSTSSSTTSSSSSTTTSTTVTTTSISSAGSSIIVVTQTFTTFPSTTPTNVSGNRLSKGTGFFANSGAVAGVFTVVGLLALALLALLAWFIVRRRRQAELDRAMTAEALQSEFRNGHDPDPNRRPFTDDEFNDSTDAYYGSTLSHGTYGQAPMPAGAIGSGTGGAWDPYNQYPMQTMPDRASVTTGTTAGMAGLGAAAYAAGRGGHYGGAAPPPPPADGNNEYAQQHSKMFAASGPAYGEPGSGEGGAYSPPQPAPNSLQPGARAHYGQGVAVEYDPYVAGGATAAAAGAGAAGGYGAHGAGSRDAYHTTQEDPYGGYEDDPYSDAAAVDRQRPARGPQPAFLGEQGRTHSNGTYHEANDADGRTLQVANR